MTNIIFKESVDKSNEKILIYKVDIFDFDNSPYFFIRNSMDSRKYRISISFEYLNKKFGLCINVIRDFSKLKLSNKKLEKFISNFDLVYSDEIITIEKYKNVPDDTNIFLVSKLFNNLVSKTLVYFSKDIYDINQFLKKYL